MLKIGEIKNSGAMGAIYATRLSDGKRAYDLMKVAMGLEKELEQFQEFKNQVVKDTGKDSVKPGDPEFQEVVKKINEAGEALPETILKPLVKPEEATGSGLTTGQLMLLDKLGLIIEEEEETKESPKARG